MNQIDDIKGKRARVINTITPGGIDGKVEFNGTNWDADAEEIIQSGEIVVIEARNNLRLIVKRSTANENKGKPESE